MSASAGRRQLADHGAVDDQHRDQRRQATVEQIQAWSGRRDIVRVSCPDQDPRWR